MNLVLGLIAAIIILVLTGGAGWLFALLAIAAGFSAQSADKVVTNPQTSNSTAYVIGCGELVLLAAAVAFLLFVIL